MPDVEIPKGHARVFKASEEAPPPVSKFGNMHVRIMPIPEGAPEMAAALGLHREPEIPKTRVSPAVIPPEARDEAFSDPKQYAGFMPRFEAPAGMEPRASQPRDTSHDAREVVSLQLKNWQAARAGHGGLITRLPVGHMDQDQVQAIKSTLESMGLKPQLHKSESLGMTIRLEGADAAALMKMQPKQPGGPRM